MLVVVKRVTSGYTPLAVPRRASSSLPSGQATGNGGKELVLEMRVKTYIHDTSQQVVSVGGDVTFDLENLLRRNGRRFIWGFIAAQSMSSLSS